MFSFLHCAALGRDNHRGEGRIVSAHGQKILGLVAGQGRAGDDQARSGLADERRGPAHVFRNAHFHIQVFEGGEYAGYGLGRRQK